MDSLIFNSMLDVIHFLLQTMSTWYNDRSATLSSAQSEIQQLGWIKKVRISRPALSPGMMRNWHAESQWRQYYSTDFAGIHKIHDFWSMKGKSFISWLTMAITMNTASNFSFLDERNVSRIEFLPTSFDGFGLYKKEAVHTDCIITHFIYREMKNLH